MKFQYIFIKLFFFFVFPSEFNIAKIEFSRYTFLPNLADLTDIKRELPFYDSLGIEYFLRYTNSSRPWSP